VIPASRISLALIVGVFAVLLPPPAKADSDGPRPVIEVREIHKDGGLVEEGTVVHFQFEVANRGQADLQLKQVKSPCGCAVTKWDRVIEPGAQGLIHVEMNTQYFRGAVTKHLTLISNDPDRLEIELTIALRLIPLVNISPGLNAVLDVTDRAVTQEFTLERNGQRPMKIVQVIPNAPYIDARTTPLPGQGRYKLTVTATPAAPLGRSNVAVTVWTDVEKGAVLTFFITVDRGIVAVPPSLFYGMVPQELDTPRQASLTIRRDSAPFRVTGATVNDSNLTLKLETVRESAEYRVTVTYAGGWNPGRWRQMLTVTTDDPKQPVIEIPVQAVVQAKIALAAPVAVH
jgi:hypothetical protein